MGETTYLEPVDFALKTLYEDQVMFLGTAELFMREYLKYYIPLVIGLIVIGLLGLLWIRGVIRSEEFKLRKLLLPIITTTISLTVVYAGVQAIVNKDKETYAGLYDVEHTYISMDFRGIVYNLIQEGYSEEEIKKSVEIEISEVYTEEALEKFVKPGFLPKDYANELKERLFKEVDENVAIIERK